MQLPGKRRARWIALATLAAVLTYGGALAYRRASDFYARLDRLIVAELQGALGRPLAIGAVEFRQPGLLRLRQVRLPGSGDGPPIAEAERIDVRYRWDALVYGDRDPVAAIREVVLVRPRLNATRAANGKWDLEELFRPRGEPRPLRFRGRVTVRDGEMVIRDARPPGRPAGAPHGAVRTDLHGLAVRLDFGEAPRVTFNLTATVVGEQGGRAVARGYFRTDEPVWLARLDARGFDAAYWSGYLALPVAGSLRAGRADLQLVATPGATAGSFVGEGTVRLSEATLRIPGLSRPLEGATVELVGTPELIDFRGRGSLAGTAVTFSGSSLSRPRPRLALSFRAAPAGLAPLCALFPRAAIPGDLQVDGPLELAGEIASAGEEVSASGRVRAPRVAHRGIELADLEARWHAAGGVVEVRDFRARAAGGTVTARGWVATGDAEPEIHLRGSLAGINLAQLPRPAGEGAAVRLPEGVGGTADFEFLAQGATATPTVRGELRLARVTIDRLELNEVRAHVEYTGERLLLRASRAVEAAGQGYLAGTIGADGTLDLRAQVTAPSLQALAARYGHEDLDGAAEFRGTIAGTLAAPRISGAVQLHAPRWRETSLDHAAARIETDGSRVTLSDVRLYRLPAVLSADRVIIEPGADNKPRVAGSASLNRLTLAQLAQLLGGAEWLQREPLAGRLESLAFDFSGPLEEPELDGRIVAESVALRGLKLGRVEARGAFSQATGRLTIASFLARLGTDQRIEGSGSLPLREDPAGTVTARSPLLHVEAAHLPLVPALRRWAPEVLDFIDVEGEIASLTLDAGGQVEAPRVTGQVATGRLRLNGEPFLPGGARFRWEPELVAVQDLDLRSESGLRVEVPAAGYFPGPAAPQGAGEWLRAIAGECRIEGLSLAIARTLLRRSPYAWFPEGREMESWLGRLPESTGGSLELGVVLPGPMPLRGDWWNAREDVAAYRQAHAAAIATFSVPDLVVVGLPAEETGDEPQVRPINLRLDGRVTARQGQLDLEQLTLDQVDGDALVAARGWWRRGAGREARLQVDLDAVNIPLTTVARLPVEGLRREIAPLLPLKGMAELHLSATGNPRAPEVTLSASVDRPVIAGLPFTRLDADQVRIDPEREELELVQVDVVQEHLERDHTHRVRLTGTLPFSWSLPGIVPDRRRDLAVTMAPQSLDLLNDLAAVADPERPDEAPGTGLSDHFRQARALLRKLAVAGGTMEARLHLGGTANLPENTGFIALNGGELRLGPGETSIQGLEARLEFAGNALRVQRLAGRSNRSGGFQVTGSATLGRGVTGGPSAELDLALEVAQFRFLEDHLERIDPKLRGATVRGTLQTVDRETGREPTAIRITGPWNHPRIAGGLRLTHASTGLPPAVEVKAARDPLPLDADLDLRFFFGEDVTVRNPLVDMRLGNHLAITNTLSAPVIMGRVAVLRGTLQLPTLRFRIEGSVRVNYDARQAALGETPASPLYVELTGTTRMALRESPTLPAEDVELILSVRGAPLTGGAREEYDGLLPSNLPGQLLVGVGGEGLSVEIHSDPPLPAGQLSAMIRQELGLEGILASEANLQAVLQHQVQRALANAVAPLLTSRIEDYVQRALRLDQFTIEVGGVEQPLQLRVGKRLFEGFYGSFTQRLGGPLEQGTGRSYELYYRLTPRLRLGIRQDDQPYERRLFFLSGSLRFK